MRHSTSCVMSWQTSRWESTLGMDDRQGDCGASVLFGSAQDIGNLQRFEIYTRDLNANNNRMIPVGRRSFAHLFFVHRRDSVSSFIELGIFNLLSCVNIARSFIKIKVQILKLPAALLCKFSVWIVAFYLWGRERAAGIPASKREPDADRFI